MKIALCQMRMSEDAERNCQKALEQIAQAAEAGARLILFPEVDLPAASATRERKPYTSLRRPELYL